MLKDPDDFIFFDDKASEPAPASKVLPWKLLVVDDEEDVHTTTKLALRRFQFESRPLQLLHAYSGIEGKKVLEQHPDVSLVLLDVVMESDDAGLKLVESIRNELKNDEVRIVLRTGQPGNAPEWDVVNRYLINDYVAKTELTQNRLFTILVSSFRSFRDFRTIKTSKQGLAMVLDATSSLVQKHSLQQFANGVLLQLSALLNIPGQGMLALRKEPGHKEDLESLSVLAGLGSYESKAGTPLLQILNNRLIEQIHLVLKNKANYYTKDQIILFLNTPSAQDIIVLLDGAHVVDSATQDVLTLYCDKVSTAFDNLYLIDQLQQEKELLEVRVKERTAELRDANNKLTFMATTDELTGLKNRRYFFDYGYSLKNKQLSLLMLDVDYFKQINDTYGHQGGDLALVTVANTLVRYQDKNTTVARVGGEEFALLITDGNLECVLGIAEKIREAIKRLAINYQKQTIRLTVSIGVSITGENKPTLDELYQYADQGLYQAKQGGRNKVCYFKSEK